MKSGSEICELFASKLSSIAGISNQESASFRDIERENLGNLRFRTYDIHNAIKKLNVGISFDRIHSNHLKYLSDELIEIICSFFNLWFKARYFPSKMEGVY